MRTLASPRVPPDTHGQPAKAAPPSDVQGGPSDTFRELFFILRRRKWAMAGVLAVVMAGAAVFVAHLTPLYTATAVVTIDERKMQVVDIENVLGGLRSDEETIQTEVQILTSNRIVRDTVRALHLIGVREFNQRLNGATASWTSRLVRALRTLLHRNVAATAAGDRADATDPIAELMVIAAVRAHLHVDPIGRSRAIQVAFTSADPALAEKVANTIADLYLTQQLEAQVQASQRAEEWLTDRIGPLRQEVDEAERKVEAFRTQSAADVGMGASDITDQMKELDTSLVKAKGEYDLQNAKLASIEEATRAKGPAAAGRLLDSPLIQTLETQETTLLTAGAELAKRYGPLHPTVVKNAAEHASVVAQIDAALQNALATQRNDVRTLAGRVGSLQADLDRLRARAARSQEAQVTQRALQRDADARRTVLESFLNRAKQLEQTGLQEPDARIVSEAMLPLAPSFPRVKILLGVAFALGLGLAVALAAALEMLERGLKSREEVESHLLVPAVGVLPRVDRGFLRRGRPQDLVLDSPVGAYAESLRGIVATLALVQRPAATATILFTSTVPKEGKTVLVVSLARALAAFGHRVLVVDCDLRRPMAHRYVGLANLRGVAEVVTGTVNRADAVQRDPRSRIDLISAGRARRGQEQAILGGIQDMMNALREVGDYDCILIDAPPVLAVSDARLLTTQADACVYVVRWRRTSRQAAQRGLRLLDQDGAPVVGAVLTAVDPAIHKKYGICDEGHYPGAKSYYSARS